jgi:predicted ATPase
MINKVSIRNFKCLRDVKLDLERFTVFVGPNGSGKSSVLQALHLLCEAFAAQSILAAGQADQWMSRGTDEGVELSAESEGRWYRYRSRADRPLGPTGRQSGTVALRESCADSDRRQWEVWQWAGAETLPRSVMLRLEASKLVSPQAAPGDSTAMAPDGLGMHSALANVALNDPDTWQALQADLRQIIPTIRRLRFTKGNPTALLFDTVGGDSLPAHQVSDGTLLVLGLLTALRSPDRPGLVLLDDLERGLHPLAQRDLVALLRGILETNRDLQIVATTHSPYLLNWMDPAGVRMTHLADGFTVCGPLTDHPKFKKWKEEFSPGEMWSMFGEKWLVGAEVPV